MEEIGIQEEKVFANIMDSLYTYYRIIHNYQNTPRNYGGDELLFLTEAHTIEKIGDNPGLSLNELAEKTYRTKPAMSMLIKSLVKKDLVKRIRDEEDNRRYIITLTEEGQRVYDYHRQLDSKNYKDMLHKINDLTKIDGKDLETTSRVLEVINKLLSEVHSD